MMFGARQVHGPPLAIMGVTTMEMMSNTNTTSTSGVTLISDFTAVGRASSCTANIERMARNRALGLACDLEPGCATQTGSTYDAQGDV